MTAYTPPQGPLDAPLPGVVGDSPAMRAVYRLTRLVAPTRASVLIIGETGTGKELVARAIHEASPRRERLLVKVNCAAISAGLVESESRGRERLWALAPGQIDEARRALEQISRAWDDALVRLRALVER